MQKSEYALISNLIANIEIELSIYDGKVRIDLPEWDKGYIKALENCLMLIRKCKKI